jgi:predicted  nucleic acid-binding Zn-ribbon protein
MPYLILLLLLGSMGGGAWYYYTDTQERMAVLRDNNAKLALVAETNQETINNLQEDYAIAQENMEKLAKRAQEAEVYQDELAAKLRRHDLTMLTMQKPGLIEKRVNNATAKIFSELEIDSGAEPIISTDTE